MACLSLHLSLPKGASKREDGERGIVNGQWHRCNNNYNKEREREKREREVSVRESGEREMMPLIVKTTINYVLERERETRVRER